MPNMTPDELNNAVDALLKQLLALPVEERQAVLDGLRSEQPDVCARVESILATSPGPASATKVIEPRDSPMAADGTSDSIHDSLAATKPGCAPAFDIPGYEMVKKLGDGGMGVVYQARDKTLNRIVAVKMLRTGGPATSEQLARFQVEAQAIAQLQHPHIVQIFSSGSDIQTSRPFFVMEYVEGGTLANKLAGRPQPPADAARLVMLLARAT